MINEYLRSMCFFTGSYGEYQWLESYPDLNTFVKTFPESVVGKYLAITSADCTEFKPDPNDVAAGWTTSEGIAYSPRIDSISSLPKYSICPYVEWYAYDQPMTVGRRQGKYSPDICPPDVFPFASYRGYAFDSPEMKDYANEFLKQLSWMRPVSYIASDGSDIFFVSRDPVCFASVRRGLENWIWPYSNPGK